MLRSFITLLSLPVRRVMLHSFVAVHKFVKIRQDLYYFQLLRNITLFHMTGTSIIMKVSFSP